MSVSSPVTARVSAAEPWPAARVPSAASTWTSTTTYSTASVRRFAVTNGRSSGARRRWTRTLRTVSGCVTAVIFTAVICTVPSTGQTSWLSSCATARPMNVPSSDPMRA